MKKQLFQNIEQLIDVPHLLGCCVVVLGAGMVGFNVATGLASSGVGSIVCFDHDTVSRENVIYGLPLPPLNREKVYVLGTALRAINPHINYRAIHKDVLLHDFDELLELFRRADCLVYAIDSFDAASFLVEAAHALVLSVCAVHNPRTGLSDAAFSAAPHTPCLNCSMRLRERITVHGAAGPTLPDFIWPLRDIVCKYVLALLLRGDGHTRRRGFEFYGHYLDPRRCRGILVNHPTDAIPNGAATIPLYFQPIEVVTASSRPMCRVCEGYTLEPL